MATKFMYPNNTQTVLTNITAQSNNAPVTGATVTCTLKNSDDKTVRGCTKLAMTEVDSIGSPGLYSATIDASQFNPPVGIGYALYVHASQSGELLAKQDIEIKELATV